MYQIFHQQGQLPKNYQDGKLTVNFEGLVNENDLKKITNQKFVKNYSVKSEKDKVNISGIAIFQTNNDKEQFLNEWYCFKGFT